jgi:hypothetical protein
MSQLFYLPGMLGSIFLGIAAALAAPDHSVGIGIAVTCGVFLVLQAIVIGIRTR